MLSFALGGQHSLALSDPTTESGHSKHILPEEHQIYSNSEQAEDVPSEFHTSGTDPSGHMGKSHLFSWGMGDFGCLGQQHFTSELQPAPVQTFEALIMQHSDEVPIVNDTPAIAAAGAHSLLVDRFASTSTASLTASVPPGATSISKAVSSVDTGAIPCRQCAARKRFG